MECLVLNFKDVMEKPPALGSTISVKHSGCYETGMSKRPIFWRIKSTDIETSESRVTQEDNIFKPQMYDEESRCQQNWNRMFTDRKISPGFWSTKDNQRRFFIWLGNQLGFKQIDDWYRLTLKDIILYNGKTLIGCYSNSVSTALQAVFPEHNWMVWRFKEPPKGYWEREKTAEEWTRITTWLSEQLSLKLASDWSSVSVDRIWQLLPFNLNLHSFLIQEMGVIATTYGDHLGINPEQC